MPTEFINFHKIFSPFGFGVDGPLVIAAGTTVLVRDMYYTNLTINGTGALNTNGFRVFVSDTLDLTAAPAGAIFANPGTANGNLAGGGAGGTVPDGNGSAGNNGGIGGTGGNGYLPGRVGGAVSRIPPGRYQTDSMLLIKGGAGGGAGGSGCGGGGSGGSGGGVIWISASIISRGAGTAAGAINAPGQIGNNSVEALFAAGGGAGGGGGWVCINFGTLTGSAKVGAVSGSGGTGGPPQNGGADGGGGSGGILDLINLTTSTVTTTTGAAGAGTVGGALTGTL